MRASAAVPMTGAAPVVVRIVVVAGLALLLRAELWLPLASALGLLAVMARRRWLHQRHWLPAQVALVALVHAAPAFDRPSDALMAAVAPARDRRQVVERAAAQLRRRGHAGWAVGSEQLGLAGHAAEALPAGNGVGRLLIVTVSAAVCARLGPSSASWGLRGGLHRRPRGRNRASGGAPVAPGHARCSRIGRPPTRPGRRSASPPGSAGARGRVEAGSRTSTPTPDEVTGACSAARRGPVSRRRSAPVAPGGRPPVAGRRSSASARGHRCRVRSVGAPVNGRRPGGLHGG